MFCLVGLLLLCVFVNAQYQPTWDSLNSRPLPSWYDQAKFGIFMHWGVYSVPSYGCVNSGSAGEWYWWNLDGAKEPCLVQWHTQTYGANFKYEDFAPMWKTVLFNASSWANLFKQSGAKYVVLTSKHHDGFCNWPSSVSWNWNSVDAGPHQDNVKIITNAVRAAGLRMGLYHSLFEWFHPLYLQDKKNNGATTLYVDEILQPQLRDIVNSYQPEIIWSDGDWEMPDTYWKSKEFLAWLYNQSPVKATVVVNDRWGINDTCKNGGYWTCSDRYNPGKLVNHKWENAFTVDRASWGYRRNAQLSDILSIEELVTQLVSTVAFGGNFLLNVGPTAEGQIVPIFQERLTQLGQWLSVCGPAIYATQPWRRQYENTTAEVYYTLASDGKTVNAIMTSWPSTNVLVLTGPNVSQSTQVILLGYGSIAWDSQSGNLAIKLTQIPVHALPTKWAWVFQLKNVN